MLNARFESAEATFVAGTIWLEGAVLAFDSVCKIFKALIIKFCVSCGSSSILDINISHALHYAQPRSTRRLLLQGAFKLDCTPSLEKYFPPFVSVNHCYEAVLFCPSKPFFGEVYYVYLLSDGSSLLPWASIKVSQSVIFSFRFLFYSWLWASVDLVTKSRSRWHISSRYPSSFLQVPTGTFDLHPVHSLPSLTHSLPLSLPFGSGVGGMDWPGDALNGHAVVASTLVILRVHGREIEGNLRIRSRIWRQ